MSAQADMAANLLGSRLGSRPEWIPATMARHVGMGVYFRPILSWHSGNYAGERRESVRGDKSGCLQVVNSRSMCSIPYTVTHRVYWHAQAPERRISAFLSYPNGMGSSDVYFWEVKEVNLGGEEGVTSFTSEEEMEEAVREHLVAPIRAEIAGVP